jgi:enoyl-CoA hydratase/carnithine racemase
VNSFPVRPSTPDAAGAVRLTRPRPAIALVTLDRPESLNALDSALIDGMATTFTQLSSDDTVSVVVVTGAGRSFSSGADLSLLAEGVAGGPPLEMMRYVGRSLLALAELPQLTLAAVNGPAVGAGWGVAMACDIRIASPQATFGATFVRMGLGPDYGLSATLPQAVGRQRALELLTTGRFVDAAEALHIGLVSEVADCAQARALELAYDVAAVSQRAIRSVKATLRAAQSADMDDVVDRIEAHAQAALFEHPDFLTGAATWMGRHRGK